MSRGSLRVGAGIVTTLLAVSGASWATGALQTSAVDTGATVYEVADAGTATLAIEGAQLVLLEVTPATGWSATVDSQTDIEIEIDFTTDGRRIRFNAELEDGAIRTRTEERVAASIDPVSNSTTSTSTTTPTTSSTTPTTAPILSDAGASSSDQTYDVRGAGTVTLRIEGPTLVLVDAAPAAGWTVSIDSQTTREIEIDFRRDGARIRFNGQIEDGQIRVRTEVREGSAPTDATSTTAASDETSTGEVQTFDVPGVATVTVAHDAAGLTLLTVMPREGWTVEIDDARGDRIRIEFASGEIDLRFEVRWDDGRFRYDLDENA